MTDEQRDESHEDESDENLDEELEDDESGSESGDESAESETSEDEDDQSEDDESDDSTSQEDNESETDDEESEDDESEEESESDQPNKGKKDIAKYERNRRKSAERENRHLKAQLREAGLTPQSDVKKSDPPKVGLADRFWSTVAKVDIMEIAQTDPTVHQRSKMIQRILQVEMPELMKNPNGVYIANDIAKGRTIKETPGTEDKKSVQRKTSPAKPRGNHEPSTGFVQLSQEQYDKLSPDGQIAYERNLQKHLASKGKK